MQKGLNVCLTLDRGRLHFKPDDRQKNPFQDHRRFQIFRDVFSAHSGRYIRYGALSSSARYPRGDPASLRTKRPFTHFAPFIRYEKSLQNLKTSVILKRIFLRSPGFKMKSPRSH